jgi:hypothetical protein
VSNAKREPCCQGECPICLEADREDGREERDFATERRDRERAVALFVAAGKPLPAWLRRAR